MSFFEFPYQIKNFYGAELYEHLKGWDDNLMDYNPDYNQFLSIFGSTLLIAVVLFVAYYYIINHPRFNRWWSWLIFISVAGLLAYGWGFNVVNVDILNRSIAPSLINHIGATNAIMFGIYNMIFEVIVFLVFTLLFRHWSKNCKHSPWKSLLTTRFK